MKQSEFYSELKRRFEALLAGRGLLGEAVSLRAKSLTPEEAIGLSLIHISEPTRRS